MVYERLTTLGVVDTEDGVVEDIEDGEATADTGEATEEDGGITPEIGQRRMMVLRDWMKNSLSTKVSLTSGMVMKWNLIIKIQTLEK